MKDVIKVKGMMCAGCEKRVNAGLLKLEGVRFVQANSKTGEVQLEFDEALVTLDDMKETIEEIGYDIN